VIHGATVATNAIIERKGARTAMLTTAGFRDVIHIGRHQRPQNYSMQQDIPWQANPLVDRYLRFEIPERLVPPRGDVLVELDERSVRQAAAEMRRVGVTAVAVCFLFSYEGSYGARSTKDDMDVVDTLYTNTRCAPIEEIETAYPLRCRRWMLNDKPLATVNSAAALVAYASSSF